jgi:hypothetical protein
MGKLMTASQFPRLMDDRLTKVFDKKFAGYQSNMIPKMYNVQTSDKAFDEFYDIEGLPDIPEMNGSLSYISSSPGYYTKIEQKEYGAITQFERKLLDFKRYRVMDNRVGDLGEALARTMEKRAVRPFANAFSAAFDYQTSEEGVSLCSTAHTTKVPGVSTTSGFSNSGTTAISKTAIAAARLAGKRFRMGNGELINVRLDTVVVPSALYDTACEATGYDPRNGATSDLDPDNLNNKVNVVRGIKVIEWTYLDDYSTKNWFMVDFAMMKKFLLWINSQKAEIENRFDYHTKAAESSVYARWANGFTAWQWMQGNQVT